MPTITPTVKANLIKDSGQVLDKGVLTIRRVYAIYGIDPAEIDPYNVAANATGLPFYGQSHPNHPFAQAKIFEFSPFQGKGVQSSTAIQCIVTYNNQMAGVSFSVEFGSTLSQIDTDTDRDGNEIFVTWSARKEDSPANGVYPAGYTSTLIPQRAKVPKFVRHDTLKFQVWLINPKNSFDYPTPIELLKEKYLGKVNKTNYRGGIPHDWMITICDGVTQDYGKSYIITMEMERRPVPVMKDGPIAGGWDEWAWYTVEDGGIAYGVSKKNQDGVKLINNIYNEVEFSDIPADFIALKTTVSTS